MRLWGSKVETECQETKCRVRVGTRFQDAILGSYLLAAFAPQATNRPETLKELRYWHGRFDPAVCQKGKEKNKIRSNTAALSLGHIETKASEQGTHKGETERQLHRGPTPHTRHPNHSTPRLTTHRPYPSHQGPSHVAARSGGPGRGHRTCSPAPMRASARR